MPIYDYACSACGHVTEVVHGIHDHGPKFCPECGAEATMTKAFSTPAIHFKGTGWAKKDRGSSARATAKAKDDGTTKESAAKDSGTKDTGPKEPASAGTAASGADKGSSAGGTGSTAATTTPKPD